MNKTFFKIIGATTLIVVCIVSLASTVAPSFGPLFSAFNIIERRLEEFKKADPSTLQKIKNEFDMLVGNELARDSNVLTSTGPYGLTPAHLLILHYFLFSRALHFHGLDLWKGQSEAYRELFKYAFSKLDNPKAVLVSATGESGYGMEYLKESPITKKPMTASELRDSLLGKIFPLTLAD